MKIKRILSIFLVITLSFGMCTIAFAEENIGIPEDGEDFMPTLPPSEDVEISVVYRPLKSMVSFANFGPFLAGTVLEVTYADGKTETVILQTNWTGLSDYVAGKYNVYTSYFNTMEIKSPGINQKTIYITKHENGILYEGLYKDFSYLYIPSLGEWLYLFSSLIRIYNPFA